MSQVIADSGVILKLVLPEDDSRLAAALWEQWLANEVQVVAPSLLAYELTSVIRNKVQRKQLTPEQGEQAFAEVWSLAVLLEYPPDLHRRAWELAKRFNRPNAYDSHYLALAEMLGCEFWTADERLFNAVSHELAWVRLLRDFKPGAASTS